MKYNPEYGSAWGNLALLLETVKKDYPGAEEAYHAALKCNPEYAMGWTDFGIFLYNCKKD